MKNTRSPSGKPWLLKGLIILFLLLPVPVLAQGPVDLTLGATGAFPWSVSGIVPGSSGSTSIELHNSGTDGGTLYIWLDNISETDPHGSGTALGNYMYFNVSHPRLLTSVPLPANVYSFPTVPLGTNYIIISPFAAGETIKLNWTWEFRETGTPQNDAQNAVLRFNISYMLVAMPPPPTTAPTPSPVPTPTPGGGGGGGGGGGDGSITYTSLISRVLQQLGPPEPPQPVCQNVSQNYTAGFVGMLYNADNEKTLDLNISQARSENASVTIYPDHIDVYQHDLTIYPDHVNVYRPYSGGVLFRFWMDTSDIRNTTRIVKRLDSAELWTDPLVANLTTGTYTGSIHAVPLRIFPQSVIRITLTDCINPEITGEIRNVSTENNLTLGDIPYAMDVERFNLTEIGETNVSMTLPVSWVDRRGGRTDSVHIARIANMTRKTALINSVFVGSDSNANMIFRGDSPYGSSLYAIFSETGLQKQEQYNETIQSPAIIIPAIQSWWLNSLLIAAILIIIIIALALIIIYFRRRRKRKS
jgi:hypothetical protein